MCLPIGSLLAELGAPNSPPTATAVTDNTGDPVHRFYQMWQQADCNISNATPANPSGCMHDLVTWVATTQGWGITGQCTPAIGNTQCAPPADDEGTYQGGVAMGIYNMAAGELPILQSFAQNYAINDNYHQPIMGGTGPNSQAIFTGELRGCGRQRDADHAERRPDIEPQPDSRFEQLLYPGHLAGRGRRQHQLWWSGRLFGYYSAWNRADSKLPRTVTLQAQ
jgi:phospholipase C